MGVRMNLCPCRFGMVGPNMGWVPRISTSAGAYFCIARVGPVFREVRSMSRLPALIRGATSAMTCSVMSIGTEIITTSLSATSECRS